MAVKYIPFFPEPIEGQAILDSFSRTLKYKGNFNVKDRLQRGMPFYEVETTEVRGKNPDNMIIRGECLSACAYLKDQGIKVDLVYIDPPFASGADYAKKVYIRKNPQVAKAISKAEAELDIEELKMFEEKMYGDVWNKEDYLNWMYENLMAIKSVMSDTASIYVHLDWHIGHYVKILMDEIFGEDKFKNEIIWQYFMGGKGKKEFAKKHDTILFYVKNPDNYVFNQFKVKRYLDFIPSLKDDSADAETGKDEIGYYSIVACPDVWPIKGVFNMGNEYIEYPTQKPEELLERIITASSNEKMIVADFFGGSGVTAAVSNKMNRRFIHCDIGMNSIQITRDRLVHAKADFVVKEIKDGVSLYRNPVQTMEKMKSLIKGLKNEDALDKYWEGVIQDSKYGMVPVHIPNLVDSSTKLLDLPMMNDIIHKAIPDLPVGVKKVIVYYIDVTNLNEIKKFINEDDSTTVEIELRDLKELLDDVVIEDVVDYTLDELQEELFKEYRLTINKFVSDRVIQKLEEYNSKKAAQALKGENRTYIPITISENGLDTIEYVSLDCTSESGAWHSDSEIKIDGKTSCITVNGEKKKEFWDGTICSKKKPLRLKVRNICGDESIIKIS